MGTAPPPEASVGVDAGFAPATTTASICGFAIGIPRLVLGISIVLPFSFPPKIPFPHFTFALTCSITDPVKVDAGLPWGAGRKSNAEPDPDDDEDAA